MKLHGLIRVIDDEEMQQVHLAALDVLERTGMILRGRYLLEALADAGCRVDFQSERVRFLPDLITNQIEKQRDRYTMVRSSLWYPFCDSLPRDDAAWPDRFTVDYGFATPCIYDYPEGRFRTPTVEDQALMIRLGDSLEPVRAVCAPLICGDVDTRVEIIESSRLLLLNTNKPGWVGTSDSREVKYLADLAHLATENLSDVDRTNMFHTRPPLFVHAYCTTSPLKLDTNPCMILQEALRYGFPVNFAPMPILGGTTPVTPAGSLVIATAELLGCLTAATLIAPDVYCYGTVITGEMDMKTTQVCYSVVNVEPAYLEAKCPGIQAAFMKTYRQMALASMVSASLPIGLLDNGSVFSPVQAMIDLDMNEAQYRLSRGLKIDDDTLSTDLINSMAFCEHEAYLQTEHTLKFFRSTVWDTKLFDRDYRRDEYLSSDDADERILRRADEQWRRLVSSHDQPHRDKVFLKELDRIVSSARVELLT
jgi:trimethylamine--corrinoid protein Co-methyltransferase